jgi:serine/threonine-protein kinase
VIAVPADRYAPGVVVEQKYELVRLLGEGGMGAVWVAKNLTLGVHVALKLMHAEMLQRLPGASERMLQEARAAAAIGHPAIVQIFDFGRTRDGDPFISMELLDGEGLASVLKRRERLAPARVLQVLLPIADALSVAHRRGVVHRDLKPDNIFLARYADGRTQPKLLDFGIAKLESDASLRLTLDGTVLGSPAYMAPEQARGEPDIDQRADVWAFSVMVYELVTGCLPFHGQGYNALLWAISEQTPLSFDDHGVEEPELYAILERGLAKKREDRFQTLRAMGKELAGWLLEREVDTDCTRASLRSWETDSAAILPSMFASLSPEREQEAQAAHGQRLLVPLEATAAPPLSPVARAAPTEPAILRAREPREGDEPPPRSLAGALLEAALFIPSIPHRGKSRARTGARPVAPAPKRRGAAYALAIGGSALVGLVLTLLLRPAPPSAHVPPPPVATEPPAATAPPSPPLRAVASPASPPAPVTEGVEPAPAPRKATRSAPSRKRPPRKETKVTDLKNPFAQ